jgi:hypothetical protein
MNFSHLYKNSNQKTTKIGMLKYAYKNNRKDVRLLNILNFQTQSTV